MPAAPVGARFSGVATCLASARMKSLYLRIYATVVVVLMLFAALSGWLFQRQIEQRARRVPRRC